jgi:hypothetical protein
VRVKLKDIPIVVGLWGTRVEAKKAMARLACGDSDKVVRSLKEASSEISPVAAVTNAEDQPKAEEVAH